MYKNYEDKLNVILSKAKGEKVELAIQDEVKRLYSNYIDHSEKYDGIFAPIGRVEDELRRWVKDFEKIQSQAKVLYKKTDKAISELGVNRNTFGLLDDLDKIIDDNFADTRAKEKLKTLQKI
jgi:Holliday junction resolvasome RuvABC ATP-dependent DNA helicase subunit